MSQAMALALTGASSPSLDTSISLHAVISFAAAHRQQLSSDSHGIMGCLSNGPVHHHGITWCYRCRAAQWGISGWSTPKRHSA